MLNTILITLLIVAICLILLGINVFFVKGGKFPNGHVSGNKALRNKGIILVQLENEYVYYDLPDEGKIRFLKALYQTAKSCGINVPLFIS